MSIGRYAFHDLPREMFPFTVRYLDKATGEEIDRTVVDGPGAIYVPPRDRPVTVEFTWGDGSVTVA